MDVHEATREELARLMVESGRVQYERLIVPDAELSELDDALVRGYFADVRRLPYPDDADERARALVNLAFATRHAAAGPPRGGDAQVRVLLRPAPGHRAARPGRRGGAAAPRHR